MKILKSKIDWMLGWSNSAKLEITVDKIPESDKYEFKDVGGERLYYSNNEGLVSFLSGHPDFPSTGYGGRKFELKMKDGPNHVLIGPWSSRSGVINKLFEPHCVEVVLYGSEGSFPGLGCSSAMTIELATKCLKIVHPDLEFQIVKKWDDEIYYEIDKELRNKYNITIDDTRVTTAFPRK